MRRRYSTAGRVSCHKQSTISVSFYIRVGRERLKTWRSKRPRHCKNNKPRKGELPRRSSAAKISDEDARRRKRNDDWQPLDRLVGDRLAAPLGPVPEALRLEGRVRGMERKAHQVRVVLLTSAAVLVPPEVVLEAREEQAEPAGRHSRSQFKSTMIPYLAMPIMCITSSGRMR